MKNKITCLLAGAALFGATANAEIVSVSANIFQNDNGID